MTELLFLDPTFKGGRSTNGSGTQCCQVKAKVKMGIIPSKGSCIPSRGRLVLSAIPFSPDAIILTLATTIILTPAITLAPGVITWGLCLNCTGNSFWGGVIMIG
ncbi:hypothetical protein BDR04DRAFT_1122404 [Suillus decipiens]|nr:hypothetical protein BDR04DRAFT_1122404 [Suillus decipiens]